MTRVSNYAGMTIGVVVKVARKAYLAFPNGDYEASLPSRRLATDYVVRHAQYADDLS